MKHHQEICPQPQTNKRDRSNTSSKHHISISRFSMWIYLFKYIYKNMRHVFITYRWHIDQICDLSDLSKLVKIKDPSIYFTTTTTCLMWQFIWTAVINGGHGGAEFKSNKVFLGILISRKMCSNALFMFYLNAMYKHNRVKHIHTHNGSNKVWEC